MSPEPLPISGSPKCARSWWICNRLSLSSLRLCPWDLAIPIGSSAPLHAATLNGDLIFRRPGKKSSPIPAGMSALRRSLNCGVDFRWFSCRCSRTGSPFRWQPANSAPTRTQRSADRHALDIFLVTASSLLWRATTARLIRSQSVPREVV
jgi:hypothetical protein